MTDIRIYCDHDDHLPKVVEVDRLRRNPSGGWDESPDMLSPRMASGGRDPVSPAELGERWLPRSSLQIMDGWARWDFRCAADTRHNVQVRQDKLFPRLDKFADVGMFDLSLRILAASL